MMDGRIKTLHPKIHGGILARHDRAEDRRSLDEHGILTFELVVVNLYPFEETVARPGVSATTRRSSRSTSAGRRLVRAAAKNHASSAVATAPEQYAEIARIRSRRPAARRSRCGGNWRRPRSCTPPTTTGRLPTILQATHDAGRISSQRLQLALHRKEVLRYGENPHQRGALYALAGERRRRLSSPLVNCTARSCRTTTCSISTARWRSSADDARRGGRRHQAQQSLRRGDRADAGRGHAAGARRRSGKRVRLGAGGESAARRGHGRGARRAGPVRRGDRRSAASSRTPSRSSRRGPNGRPTCG